MCNKMILINFKHVPVNGCCVYFSMIVYTNGIRNVYNLKVTPLIFYTDNLTSFFVE